MTHDHSPSNGALPQDLFLLSDEALETVAARFKADLENGLAGKPSSLKLLKSHLRLSSGTESGNYLALDFGGTNVRVTHVNLDGGRGYTLLGSRRVRLREARKDGRILDLTTKETGAETLFDYIAQEIIPVARQMQAGLAGQNIGQTSVPLGHTFSFPYASGHAGEARLITWTKEIAVSGAVGQDINRLLRDALTRLDASDIRPIAVLNDTTATLLSGSYLRPGCVIGSIMGTGHNTCYMQPGTGILNLESGNFDGAFETVYDQHLDQTSERPGAQLLEKKTSGHYLGEIIRSAFMDLSAPAQRSESAQWLEAGDLSKPWSLPTTQISRLLELDESGQTAAAPPRPSGLALMLELSRRVAARSARLVAATFLGILDHLAPEMDPADPASPGISVDGSLYEKMPGYQAALSGALQEGWARRRGRGSWPAAAPSWIFIQDGSSLGAALAACQNQL
jgi:hexokinase